MIDEQYIKALREAFDMLEDSAEDYFVELEMVGEFGMTPEQEADIDAAQEKFHSDFINLKNLICLN